MAKIIWNKEEDFNQEQDSTGMVNSRLGDHAGPDTLQQGYQLGSLTKGLVAYYPLNDSSDTSTAKDATPLGNDGTINGATYNGSGKVGSNSLSFDGSSDYIDCFSFSETAQLTISAWFKTTNTSKDKTVIGLFSTKPKFLIQFSNSNDQLSFYADDTNGDTVRANISNSTIETRDGNWHHAVFVLNGSEGTAKSYIDGTEYNSDTNSSFDGTGAGFNFYIGAYNDGSSVVDSFDGTIDDLRIYDRALSQPEIEALYNLTTPSTVTTEDTL